MTAKDQTVAQEVLGINMGRCLGVFYTNNGMVEAWESDCLQNKLNVLIILFRRYRLVANIVKVLDDDVLTQSTTVGHIREGGGL